MEGTGYLEPMVGIEPTTYSLRVNCSTPEPHWHCFLKHNKIYRFIRNMSSEMILSDEMAEVKS